MTDFLTHIWNLRISFPKRDIAIHANDIKSCFRLLKHHPNVMGAFSFVIDTILFLQCGLMFGSDFRLANWEPIQQIAEQLATALFNNHTLQEKHKHHLDKLQWDNALATASDDNSRQHLGTHGTPECTFQMGCFDPHHIISSSTTTSMQTSLTHTAYVRLLQPASKPSIFSWGNWTSTNNRIPSPLTNWKTCPSASHPASLDKLSTRGTWTSKHHWKKLLTLSNFSLNLSAHTRKSSGCRILNWPLENLKTLHLLPPGCASSYPISMQKLPNASGYTEIISL